MGEGLTSKIFYLTAKTITRTVASALQTMFFQIILLLKVIMTY